MNSMLVFASNTCRSYEADSSSSSSEFAGSEVSGIYLIRTRSSGDFTIRVSRVVLLLAELVSSVIIELNSDVSTEDCTPSLSSATVFPISSISLIR